MQIREKSNIIDDEEEKNDKLIKKDDYNIDEMEDKMFKFIIRYYFNVISRISKRTDDKNIHNLREKFKNIITNYLQNDINKAKYFLEEFFK